MSVPAVSFEKWLFPPQSDGMPTFNSCSPRALPADEYVSFAGKKLVVFERDAHFQRLYSILPADEHVRRQQGRGLCGRLCEHLRALTGEPFPGHSPGPARIPWTGIAECERASRARNRRFCSGRELGFKLILKLSHFGGLSGPFVNSRRRWCGIARLGRDRSQTRDRARFTACGRALAIARAHTRLTLFPVEVCV